MIQISTLTFFVVVVITARENLTTAFQGCHRNSTKNKKLILRKLIPLNMLQVIEST